MFILLVFISDGKAKPYSVCNAYMSYTKSNNSVPTAIVWPFGRRYFHSMICLVWIYLPKVCTEMLYDVLIMATMSCMRT